MAFDSPIFLFFFLPLALALHAGCAGPLRGARNAVLLAASLIFYVWSEKWFVFALLASAAIDFAASTAIGDRGPDPRGFKDKAALAASVAANLALLGFLKYGDFGSGPSAAVIPLGISFYTFQSMSYTIDVYRGEVKPVRSFTDFACFVALFPQLISGPIVRYREIAAQLRERSTGLGDFACGVRRFTAGLAKKVLIADALAMPAHHAFAAVPAGNLNAAIVWFGVAAFALQIYFDFSGYSDMAVGLGRMFGFRFPENFDSPYASGSIREFWRRWHMTLSRWFRDYLYIPLGGGRRPPGRVSLNLAVVFFLCGLWHGAAWSFVAWGMFHGVFLILERTSFGGRLAALPRPLQILYAQGVLFASWVIFNADGLGRAEELFRAMAGLSRAAGGDGLGLGLGLETVLTMAAGTLLCHPAATAWERDEGERRGRWGPGSLAGSIGFAALLGVTLCRVLTDARTPFLYYRF